MSASVLFATYQPMNPDASRKYAYADNDALKAMEDAVGFDPVWCFSFSSVDEFVGKSILAAPNCPETIRIFEPPTDALPIDAVQWNRLVARKGRCTPEAIRAIVGDAVNQRYAEWICPGIPPVGSPHLLAAVRIDELVQNPYGIFSDSDKAKWEELFEKSLAIASDWKKRAEDGPLPSRPSTFPEADWPEFVRLSDNKVLFENVWGRYVAFNTLARAGLAESAPSIFDVYPEMLTPEMRQSLDRKLSDVYNGTFEDGPTYEMFEELLNLLDAKLDSAYSAMKKNIFRSLGRNDPCPCGSGKKYKKCHIKRPRTFTREAVEREVVLGEYLVGPLVHRDEQRGTAEGGQNVNVPVNGGAAERSRRELSRVKRNWLWLSPMRLSAWSQKNRPTSATANYIARLEVFPARKSVDAYEEVLQVIKKWVVDKKCGRLGTPRREDPDWNFEEFCNRFEKDRVRCLLPDTKREDESTLVETDSHDAGDIQAWAMELNERDAKLRGRRWDTLAGVRRTAEGCVLYVENRFYTLIDYLGPEPKRPVPSTPAFVKSIIKSKNLVCMDGVTEVASRYEQADTPRDVNRLRESLQDPDRKLPIVVVASNDYGEYAVSPEDLSKQLIGMAHVFEFDWTRTYARQELKRMVLTEDLPREYEFNSGTVTVYAPSYEPKFARRRTTSHPRCNQFTRADISTVTEGEPEHFDVILRRSFMRRGVAANAGDVRRPADIQGLRMRQHAEERRRDAERLRKSADDSNRGYFRTREEYENYQTKLREAQATATSKSEELQQLTKTNRQLMELMKESDSKVEKAEAQVAEWTKLADGFADEADAERNKAEELERLLAEKTGECDWLQQSVDSIAMSKKTLEGELEAVRKERNVLGMIDHFPKNLYETLRLAQDAWPSKLVILDEAFDSAKTFGGSSLDEEWQIIRSIPTDLWDIYFKDDLGNKVADEYRSRSGYELALRETKQTNANREMMKQRKRMYRGTEIDITPHVKGRSSRPADAFRVNFYVDRERRVIVIGHCGAHLDTSGTRRNV